MNILITLNILKFTSNAPLWALLGVITGSLLTGFINYMLQRGQFKHNKEMFFLQNQSKEFVKELLLEWLNHKTFVARSFKTLRKRIGGYTDEELRKILHEIEAKKTKNNKSEEIWYLKEREDEWHKGLKKS